MRKVFRAAWLLPVCLASCTPEPKVIPQLPGPVGRADRALAGRLSDRSGFAPIPRFASGTEAGWIPRRGISSRWECIVIHHSASEVGGAERFDKLHRAPPRSWNELGYHFVIGNGSDTPDGFIEVGPRWTKQKHGAHCKTDDNHYNDHGIGICLVGNFEHHSPSPAQMRSLVKLIRFLQDKCSIPSGRIYSHGGLTGRTACPGRNFHLGQLHAMLNGSAYLASP